MYGYICNRCGAHLDPGERCDCIEEEENKKQKRFLSSSKAEELLENTEWQQQTLRLCC